MNPEIIAYIETEINREFNRGDENLFDKFIGIAERFYNKPVSTIADLKKRNNKLKGDFFEHFCLKYLKECYGLSQVWLYKDLPIDIRNKLNLTKRDMGIDLIGIDDNGEYYAVQAKWRKLGKRKVCIPWKHLSTFYALATRSGPYKKYIVITNAHYVKKVGNNPKDETICLSKLRKITREQWMKIGNIKENKVVLDPFTKSGEMNLDYLRNKRLAYFNKMESKGQQI